MAWRRIANEIWRLGSDVGGSGAHATVKLAQAAACLVRCMGLTG